MDKVAFGPAPEGLRVNDIVEWTNGDMFRQTASATDGSFDIDLPAGAMGGRPAEFRTFLWYCKLCERKVSHTVGVGWNIKNKVVR
jgi:hypothetical protein